MRDGYSDFLHNNVFLYIVPKDYYDNTSLINYRSNYPIFILNDNEFILNDKKNIEIEFNSIKYNINDVLIFTKINYNTNLTQKSNNEYIFEIFNSTSASKFSEISIAWKTNMPKIVETYKGLSDSDKKNITEMIKLFGKSYFSSIRG